MHCKIRSYLHRSDTFLLTYRKDIELRLPVAQYGKIRKVKMYRIQTLFQSHGGSLQLAVHNHRSMSLTMKKRNMFTDLTKRNFVF